MKKSFFLVIIISQVLIAQPQFTPLNSLPGSFSRMGFGARGIAMGNAMGAVTEGTLTSYYNPALGVFQENNSFQASYSILSLDRSLNFINFSRRFEFGPPGEDSSKSWRRAAGLSLGIINSGVSNIDGRDNQGISTGELQTSENQFFIGLSNRFSRKVALGVSVKFYYYKLYESITSTGLGFDVGVLYSATDNLRIGFVISDLNSKYTWDTAELYGQEGSNTIEKFPLMKKLSAAYKLDNPDLLLGAELEASNAGTTFLRLGAEYRIVSDLGLRAGFDRYNFRNSDDPPRFSAGFSYTYSLGDIKVGIDYAFLVEPYSLYNPHIIGVNIIF
ncbi:MAG: hypothetical protein K9G57_02855 [Ignavibacteriales bacterium]|nr:hypothetical protein [Ignavibacteriales bacterium]MCF8435757.1 hypothetical protein [Ignavibacteriales bacterium]